jgi:hypothetical protein
MRKQVAALKRREFLKASGAVSLSQLWPRSAFASPAIRRVRPSDPSWPSNAAWKRLKEAVAGNLIQIDFPMNMRVPRPRARSAKLSQNLKNPYYIGDTPGITQTLGWVDGWTTKPSVYAVAARNADDIAAARRFCPRQQSAARRQRRWPQLSGHIERARFSPDLDTSYA